MEKATVERGLIRSILERSPDHSPEWPLYICELQASRAFVSRYVPLSCTSMLRCAKIFCIVRFGVEYRTDRAVGLRPVMKLGAPPLPCLGLLASQTVDHDREKGGKRVPGHRKAGEAYTGKLAGSGEEAGGKRLLYQETYTKSLLPASSIGTDVAEGACRNILRRAWYTHGECYGAINRCLV